MEIVFRYTKGGEERLTFYPMADDARRIQLEVNGDMIYEGRSGYVDKVRTEIAHLIDGDTVDIDW